jgi:hypothetical protein
VTFPLNWYPERTSISHFDLDEPVPGRIIAYCAEEVRRQQDTPWHVFKMIDTWMWAIRLKARDEELTHGIIRQMGKMMDEENEKGYRNGPVWVGGKQKTHHMAIHGEMTTLLEDQKTLTPEIFYLRFENIHPFFDGNGRTGKVLYNYLRDSLRDPVFPPDFFSKKAGFRIQNP